MTIKGHALCTGDGVMLGRRAGSGVRQVHCQEPKTGQQNVQLYYKHDPLCPSRYIIYLCPKRSGLNPDTTYPEVNSIILVYRFKNKFPTVLHDNFL